MSSAVGSGLVFTLPVDDEGKAGVADAKVFHQRVEGLEVDRGPDEPGLVGQLLFYRYDKMGT